ncbi:hypothetical protein EJ05DRAFT_472930 [Pseudovirgaria hyperparasitica]|uniref:Secreted protein n=1 Tax=Pseudovirgaria hyperparasitica TaxID=470096 RepID=A0A6A6WGS3_9PEZI|nr:uncharacterized protein EJ05DRAFT_472930 [Pseudovirgaria hyperparasitica]KAF2761993.1 hypothetical protein EJ05DRAFT_472930 [Pseudovirgaria hyperparasitica]
MLFLARFAACLLAYANQCYLPVCISANPAPGIIIPTTTTITTTTPAKPLSASSKPTNPSCDPFLTGLWCARSNEPLRA